MTAEAVHALTDADLAKMGDLIKAWLRLIEAEKVARKMAKQD